MTEVLLALVLVLALAHECSGLVLVLVRALRDPVLVLAYLYHANGS